MSESITRAYEHYDVIYRNLTKLVLDRFNYFLISSAFLVGAYVATAGKPSLVFVSLVLALIGIFISAAFMVINYVNIQYSALVGNKLKEILELPDDMDTAKIYAKVDSELAEKDRLDKSISGIGRRLKELICIFCVALNPFKCNGLKKLRDFNSSNYFSYTWGMPMVGAILWIIPLVALVFWDKYIVAIIIFWILVAIFILMIMKIPCKKQICICNINSERKKHGKKPIIGIKRNGKELKSRKTNEQN